MELVKEMPDEVSMRTILDELEFLARIEQGIAEAERGEVVPHAEVMKEMDQWLKSLGQ